MKGECFLKLPVFESGTLVFTSLTVYPLTTP